jgi:hypothetical protein
MTSSSPPAPSKPAGPKPFVPFVAAVGISLLYAVFIAPLFASVANPDANVPQLEVYYSSFDNGPVGTAFLHFMSVGQSKRVVTPTAGGMPVTLPTLTFVDPSKTSPTALTDAVRQTTVYASVFVNAGASANLASALNASSFVYDATTAITLVWDEARQNAVTSSRIAGPLMGALGQFAEIFAEMNLGDFLAAGKNASTVSLSRLIQPIYYTNVNLFPMIAPVINQGLAVGLILIVVFSLIVTNVVFGGAVEFQPYIVAAKKQGAVLRLFLIRMGFCVLYSGAISLTYATILVSLANVNNIWPQLGGHTDGLAWLLVWLTAWLLMMVFCSWLFLPAILGKKEAVAALLAPLIIYNSIGLNVDVANPGYKLFWYSPMWHAAEIIRNILFDTLSSRRAMHIGVLFAWLILQVSLLFVCSIIFAKKTAAAAAAAAAAVAEAGVTKKTIETPSSSESAVGSSSVAVAASNMAGAVNAV